MHLDLSDGLSSQYTRRIWFDHRDYMWVATNGGGISIYDGKEFSYLRTVHGLSHDIVWDFEEDEDGRVWIATDNGVSIYDGKDFEYINTEDGLGKAQVWSLQKDQKGRMWIGTAGGGLSCFDHGELTHYTTILGDTAVQIYDICEDVSGTLWLATHNQGVYSFRDGTFEHHSFADNGETNIVYSIEAVSVEGGEEIWAGTRNSLMRYNNGKWTFVDPATLPFRAIFDIHQDQQGDIWIATFLGIMKWNENSSQIFRKEQGLYDNFITCLTEDTWGNMWIGYRNFGISEYSGNRFVHFGVSSGFPGKVLCFYLAKDGALWIGFETNGLLKYKDGIFLHYGPDQGFEWQNISAMKEDDKGNLWIGQFKPGGFIKFDGKAFEFYQFTTESPYLIQAGDLEYYDDALWISSFSEIFKVKGDSLYHYGFRQNIIERDKPQDFFITQENTLMLSSHGGGVAYIKGNERVLLKEEHGIGSNSVFNIEQDKHGNYWFVTNGQGISILKAGSLNKLSEPFEWKYLKIEDGLSSNEVHRIFIQDDGDVWICTGQGLNEFVLNGKDIFESDYTVNFYGYHEGFTGIESDYAPIQDGRGIMWFISHGEAAKFDPNKNIHTSTPPTPVLTGIKIKLKEVDWNEMNDAEYGEIDKWNNLPTTLSLPYSFNHVLFEFNGISYADPDGTEYSWRLIGFDKEWSPWSKMNNATYANLPANNYQFELKCRDSYGNESEAFTYQFEVRKAFWQTWLFRIAVLILIILLVYLIIKWRTHRLQQRQVVLERTVEERTLKVQKQKEEIEQQQTEILDSIAYAKRIQRAILPPDDFVSQTLPNSFIFYRPKDIVAGDFYWLETVDDDIFFAAADCTGHGVPGAMVSVVCSNALNRAVHLEGIYEPGKILDRVTELVIEQFKKGDEKVKDGMDIALCRWNRKTNKFYFAGAHNPLWKFEAGSENPFEYKADKQPVGQFDEMKPFTTQEVEIKAGDRLYLFSDGYADQFGGPKGKKFKTANLKRLLGELEGMSAKQQNMKLEESFDKWRGELEQLDDVCLIGITI